MNTTRFFLTPKVFSGLIIKNRRKTFGFQLWGVSTVGQRRNTVQIDVLKYFDTMYMLFEKKKSIGFMYFKSMEKCVQRIRRFLKIS